MLRAQVGCVSACAGTSSAVLRLSQLPLLPFNWRWGKSWVLSGGCERVDGDSCSLLDGAKPGPVSPEGLGAKAHFLFGPGSPL